MTLHSDGTITCSDGFAINNTRNRLGGRGQTLNFKAAIVCACNSHNDLLAACEGALVMIRDEWEGTTHCDTYTKPLVVAIAKAKGEV